MLASMHGPVSAPHQVAAPSLATIAAVIAETFGMVPLPATRPRWRSGHFELWLDASPPSLWLRFRSDHREAFQMALVTEAGSGLHATVRGRLSARGYEDMVAADALLDGALLRASCPPLPGFPPSVPVQLLDVIEAGRQRRWRRSG